MYSVNCDISVTGQECEGIELLSKFEVKLCGFKVYGHSFKIFMQPL